MKNSHNIYKIKLLCILIPGAAIVTREMTTCVMPFTAAFYREDKQGFKDNLCIVKEIFCEIKNYRVS